MIGGRSQATVLAVTSGKGGVGKTNLAINLAAGLARLGDLCGRAAVEECERTDVPGLAAGSACAGVESATVARPEASVAPTATREIRPRPGRGVRMCWMLHSGEEDRPSMRPVRSAAALV